MATWGSWKNNGSGNGMRLGYTLTQSPSSVGSGTSSVVVTLKVYVETKRSVYDSTNSYSISGNFSGSGSVSISNGDGGGVDLIATKTRTVSTSYSGTVKSSFSASLTGINAIPGTASVSGSFYTGRRPITAPSAPSSLTITRNSDTSHSLHWTNNSPTSSSRPYQRVEVQRWDRNGGNYVTIATLSGYPTSYTNTSTRTNNQYRWRVRATNSAGASGYTYSGYWATKQKPPSTPVASKVADDIKLNWNNNAASKVTGIEVWHAADGAWEGLGVLAGAPTSYTHNSPDPTKTHTYKLKTQAGADDDAPNTYSDFSGQSNTIQLLTNPAAPTKLTPSSGVFDTAANPLTLSWQHNEVDGTSQTKYDLQYRMDGGSWTNVSASSTTQAKTFSAGTLDTGHVMQWQVRTYGQYATAPAYSPWSAISTLTLSATPASGVAFPDGVTDVDTSRITAAWSYYDDESTDQAQFKVKLYSAGGTYLLETRTGVGTATTQALTTLLQNGTDYRVGVQVQDGSGLWSVEAQQDFHVTYALPDVPTVSVFWDDTLSATVVSIGNSTGGGFADVDHNELWRSVDWETYELVATDLPPNSDVTDYIPASGGINIYLAVAVTVIEASAQSVPLVFHAPALDGWFVVNGGDAFSQIARVKYNVELTRDFSREKTLNQFAGRNYPVETAGEQRTRTYSLGMALLADDDASLTVIEEIADLAAPLVIRTPDNVRMFVSIDAVNSTHVSVYENVNFKLTQIDKPNLGSLAVTPIVFRTNLNIDPRATATANYRAVGDLATANYDGQDCIQVLENTADTTLYADPTQNYVIEDLGILVGDTITMTFDIQVTDACTIAARIIGYTGAGLSSRPASIPVDPSQGWVTISGTQTVTSVGTTGAYFRSLIWVEEHMAVGTGFYFDNFLIEVNSPDGSYFDGSTWEGNGVYTPAWTGTTDDSTSVLTRGGTA